MQEYQKEIHTINNIYETKFKEKGSQFIGQVYPVESIEEAEMILTEIRKKYYDATHHCYAFRLSDGDEKYSDDGEPNGTAGIRILNAIDHFSLTNILCVSIRYYGGTKLGVGPLGKAYYQSAFDTIEIANVITKKPYKTIKITIDYSLSSFLYRSLEAYKAKIEDNGYDQTFFLVCKIYPEHIESLKADLTEASRGEAIVEVIGDLEYLV